MTLGPPPPGTWRQNDDGALSKVLTREVKPWESLPLPRDFEYLIKQPARPFVAADDKTQEQLTVLLFTSPIPSHPDPWLLRWTYDAYRVQLPSSRIVILADGVEGAEPESYVKYKDNVRELGLELVEFKGWHYHTLMLQEALRNIVKTPLALVGEHDWVPRSRFIDWRSLVAAVQDTSERFRLIQIRQSTIAGWELPFLSAVIPWYDIRLVPTICFQLPIHLVNVSWYREAVDRCERPQNLEGSDLTYYLREQDKLKQMACYLPLGPMGRLYHLDGAHVKSVRELDGIGRD